MLMPKLCLSQVSGLGIEPTSPVQKTEHFTTRPIWIKLDLGNSNDILQARNLLSSCKPQPCSQVLL